MYDLINNNSDEDLEHRIAKLLSDNENLKRKRAEHRKLEEDLKSSEERFKILFEYAPDAYYLSDLKGTFIDGNKAAEEISGYKREELIGKSFLRLNLISTSHLHKAAPLLAKNVMGLPTGPDEFIINKKGGGQAVVEVSTFPVKIKGKHLVLGIARDITERKKVEDALKKAHDELELRVKERTSELTAANEKLQCEIEERKRIEKELLLKAQLLDRATDSIIVHGLDGSFIYMNETFYKSRGYSKDEIMSMNVRDLITLDNSCLWEQRIKKIIVKGEGVFESVHVCKNKSIIPVEVHARIIESEGKELILSVSRDIRERKLAEKMQFDNERLMNANRAKSEFLAKMSHELRTPLNAIIGFSELLLMKTAGELNEKQAHYMENVNKSSKLLLDLISDILDLSKVESGKIELVIEKISVPETIVDALDMIKEKAAKRNIVINRDLDPLLDFIEADSQRIKQILLNLIDNAVKFSKDVGGEITIITKKVDGMAQFSVRDTGIGIKEEDIGKLFKEFEQLDSGTSRKYGGSGLGLSISKKLVETAWGHDTGREHLRSWLHIYFPAANQVEKEDLETIQLSSYSIEGIPDLLLMNLSM